MKLGTYGNVECLIVKTLKAYLLVTLKAYLLVTVKGILGTLQHSTDQIFETKGL